MGLFRPEAHVKGLDGLSFIAFICNKNPARMSEFGSVCFMPQIYKVFIGQCCLHLHHNHAADVPVFNGALHMPEIDSFPASISKADLHFHCNEGPDAFFRMHFPDCKVHEAAGGLVFDNVRRLLVMIRHGIPDFPKGHLDPGESFAEGALREVSEETGIKNLIILDEAPETWHAYRQDGLWHLKRTQWFLMSACDGQLLLPQTEEGITELIWAGQEQIETYLNRTYRSLKEVLSPVILAHLASATRDT